MIYRHVSRIAPYAPRDEAHLELEIEFGLRYCQVMVFAQVWITLPFEFSVLRH